MKKLSGYFTIFLIFNILHINIFSQIPESDGAKISATILEPGTISKTINTDFGNVAIIVSAYVKMAPVGIKSTKGGIVLPVPSGTFTAAIYDYSGAEGTTYTISYPTKPFIIKAGQDSMQVADIIPDPAQNSSSELIAGVFVSITPSNVTVNYN